MHSTYFDYLLTLIANTNECLDMGLNQIRISAYSLGELSELHQSNWWQESPFIPLSTLRLHSYLNNPRAEENDVVLYLALEKNSLVGFRTLLPDHFETGKGKLSMAWLSGSWTHPDYRRQGISSELFLKTTEYWQGRLAFSNYAPHSRKLYDQMDYEWNKMELKGTRYYHRFALSSILPGRSHLFRNSTSLLKAIDKLFNSVVDAFNRRSDAPQLKFELIQQLSLEDDEFIGQFLDHQIFARSVREFNWIQSFPWVTEDTHFEKEQAKYPFSLIARQFQSFFCKFLNDKHELQALAMVHIHNGFLCMPYVFVPESQAKNLEAFIKSFVKQNKISVTTLSSSKTEKDIHLGPVSKSYDRNFFFGPELSVPQNAKINYGDGDAVFV